MVTEHRSRTIAAGEFKAKCLALMDEVARTGVEIIITKRGKPVARLEAVERGDDEEARRAWLRDSILWLGDVESPAADLDEWEALA